MIANSGALVDSYASSAGPYGGSNIGTSGNIVAGGAIANNGGIINGQKTPNTPSSLPIPTIPPSAISLPLGSPSPGNLYINQAADNVTLAPGAYVVQNLYVNYPGALSISPMGQVTIFVTGGLNLGGNENLSGVPANLTFIVLQAGWVNVNSNGKLIGNIYAPTSGVNLNSAVFGYVVGSSVTLNSGAAVHYDQSEACNTNSAIAPVAECMVRRAAGQSSQVVFGYRSGLTGSTRQIPIGAQNQFTPCLLYTSPSPRD